MIIVVFGLPGTGKSFLSRHLAEKIKAEYFNTDIIRKKYNKEGQYNSEAKAFVYNKLYEEVEHAAKSKSVIVDGTFHKRHERDKFKTLAGNLNIPIKFIEIKAFEETIQQRMKEQRVYSEADFKVYKQIKEKFEGMKEPHPLIWNDKKSKDQLVSEVMEHIYE